VKSLAVNGTEIYCDDCGTGTPLVLVHGFPLDRTMWSEQLDQLSGCCRVITPDMRGFGQSLAKGDLTTMEQMADDLTGLLDALGIQEPVVLGGLSMGGYVAFQFWRKYAARLCGLILCDTKAEADTPEVAVNRRATAERLLGEGLAPIADTMLPKLFSETTRQRHPKVIERVRHSILAADPRGIAAAARGMAERPDMTASLGQIQCPTLVLVGQNDPLSPPAMMRTMSEAIPDAEFVEIANAGHMAPLENPAEANAAICGFMQTV